MSVYEQDLKTYKKEAVTAAIELYYPQSVIDAIREAKTEAEVANILHDAREAS